MSDPRTATLSLLLFVALVGPAHTAANGQDSRWSVGVDGFYLSPNEDRADVGSLAGPHDGATYGIDGDGGGFGLAVEFHATRRLGVEIELATVDLDVTFREQVPAGEHVDTDSASLDIYLVGLQWRLLPDRRLDLTVGSFVAMTKLDDVVFVPASGGADTLTFDDDYGFGLAIGADWSLTADGGWALRSELRYLRTILESDSGGGDLDLDPLLFSVGVGYRF